MQYSDHVQTEIERAIADEALATLDHATRALSAHELHVACPTATEIRDTRNALMRLHRDDRIEARDDDGLERFVVAGKPVPPAAADAPAPRPPTTRRIVAAIEAAGCALSIAAVHQRVADVGYDAVRKSLVRLARDGRLAEQRDDDGRKRYALPEWTLAADAEPASPVLPAPPATTPAEPPAAEPGRALTCALWSNGVLSINNGDTALNLAADETRHLVAYLIRQRPHIQHLFDAARVGAESV